MACILGDCVHKNGECRTLGECGAGRALWEASQPGGYHVAANSNKTVAALVSLGLVETRPAETIEGYNNIKCATMIITARQP